MTTKNVQEQALAKAGITADELKKIEAYQSLKITSIDDKEGYEAVRKARIACKRVRCEIVSICKAGRENAVREQKEWLRYKKEYVGKVEPVETSLLDAEEWYTGEHARIAREAQEAAEKRITDRIQAMLDVNASISYVDAKTMTDDEFKAVYEAAENAFEMEQQRAEEEARKEAEESARLEAERIERERVEAEERARVAKEQEAERIRIEAEKEALRKQREAVEAKEREVAEKEAAAKREAERIESEKRRAAEMEEAKRNAAEAAVLEERRKAEAAEQARFAAERAEAERIAREKAEAELKAAQAPDKEKLLSFAQVISDLLAPTTTTAKGNAIRDNAVDLLEKVSAYIRENAEKL